MVLGDVTGQRHMGLATMLTLDGVVGTERAAGTEPRPDVGDVIMERNLKARVEVSRWRSAKHSASGSPAQRPGTGQRVGGGWGGEGRQKSGLLTERGKSWILFLKK